MKGVATRISQLREIQEKEIKIKLSWNTKHLKKANRNFWHQMTEMRVEKIWKL